ncbi:MAG: M20 family metallopeptidase [Spirochaetales bacterium]|uniref:Probable succinyl-diaminopimelate desuccinylase n=1 Tax=Candidatus Thalassospirochaeta sargassi TaxID=3119039 RepID=A0AAJ1IGZ1_9SPIO|nr:M20 family metallopeptidase [Spirochaetales bacterium]
MLTENEKKLIDLADKTELIELTQKLVQIDSVIRPETGNTEKNVVAFVSDWIEKEIGLKPLVEEVEPGRENVILTIDSGVPGPTLMFEGHTDVVSEGDPAEWTHGPFSGLVEGNKLYGRGSCDMKAGLAINLLTVRTIMKSGIPFKGKLKLCIVCDEEGMMIGVKNFIKQGHAEGVDACLVSEPLDNELCLTMKGAIRAKVKVTGKMAHGCTPLFGINPNTRMARIILAYEEYENKLKEVHGCDEFLGWPSLTFTVVQAPPAGEPAQLNVMPRDAEAWIDIRTIPGQDHDQIRSDLKAILKKLSESDSDFKAEIEYIEDRPVVSMERDEKIVTESHKAFKDLTGKEPTYNGVPGATDGTFLRAWAGIPCLVNGPGPRKLPHHVNEYADIDQMWECYRWYLLTAIRFCN